MNQTTPCPRMNQTTADLKILNYALSLEHLEAEFFKQGLAKFNASAFSDAGYGGPVRDRLAHIGDHENSHVMVLTNAITKMKGKPVGLCNYTFPLDNVTTFMSMAQALENTGVSAYLGAAAGLRGDLLTAAASITAVEARHASYLNELRNQTGFPYDMDTPLTPRMVVTIASKFVKSCPYNITVAPFTQLTATLPANGTGTVKTSFTGPRCNDTTSLFCQFMYGAKTAVSVRSNCTLPADALGYVYVLLTDTKVPITGRNETRIVAGPALLFNGNHNNTAPTNTTTSTTMASPTSTNMASPTTMVSPIVTMTTTMTTMPSPTTTMM
ncbi:hypothetical protein BG003_004919 [Podila horticola]|nr:hypothetical protein BG003_004919 [Podila horticola]